MTETYSFEKRSWYPHMMPEDRAVWERFIDAYPASYDEVQYDVVVGSVPEFVKNDPTQDQASMERLYKKKIDVVAFKGGDIDIIELKPICNMSTIGQVKGYVHFYKRDIQPSRDPSAIVICGGCSDDIREYARNEGVIVIVV